VQAKVNELKKLNGLIELQRLHGLHGLGKRLEQAKALLPTPVAGFDGAVQIAFSVIIVGRIDRQCAVAIQPYSRL
jgi:hypothetical protein